MGYEIDNISKEIETCKISTGILIGDNSLTIKTGKICNGMYTGNIGMG